MAIPIQLIILSIPSLVLIGLLRRKGVAWRHALAQVGWQSSQFAYYGWALGFVAVIGGLARAALQFIPPNLLQSENVSLSNYAGMAPVLATFLVILLREGIYTALGEEIFFRGWLGGWLIRRFGFLTGNTIQALVFLMPHLLLLTISPAFWPILIPQFVAGWLQGWLCARSGSILPGWFAHTLTNVLSVWSSL